MLLEQSVSRAQIPIFFIPFTHTLHVIPATPTLFSFGLLHDPSLPLKPSIHSSVLLVLLVFSQSPPLLFSFRRPYIQPELPTVALRGRLLIAQWVAVLPWKIPLILLDAHDG
ncbi:hypothetical protein GALMADRAFT_1302086 [Galerina marginata CBS 339.88]|uniref:Uncharacterized protein n=1 Tax=Galerina marginata (strain CBS 339.88) TaxID=685588 RepID=A0A067T6Y7_GALM3|nr:hypothetical protein GALMADRAFT_1302086 [Galerina marginata CBS 339.88]